MDRNQALGLPPGSIRAILAAILVSSVVYTAIVKGIVPETLSTLAGMAIVFYFQKGKS